MTNYNSDPFCNCRGVLHYGQRDYFHSLYTLLHNRGGPGVEETWIQVPLFSLEHA